MNIDNYNKLLIVMKHLSYIKMAFHLAKYIISKNRNNNSIYEIFYGIFRFGGNICRFLHCTLLVAFASSEWHRPRKARHFQMSNIKLKDVQFAYPSAPDSLILTGIDLEVESGEFVCLLGQSGCGKSTLLRILAGLESISGGSFTIEGEEVTGTDLDRAVVFQDYGLFPWLTAGGNIVLALKKKFPGRKKDDLKKIAIDMIKQVGLDEKVFYMYPKELSGGMKQRCAIAQAFSMDPPIMLMDEPFGALDAVTRARLQSMVHQLWTKEEKRKTVFFVTHDVDEALLLGSRICVLGQKPSKIIYDCKVEIEGGVTRQSLYSNKQIQDIREELIAQINKDVSLHID